MRCGWPICSGKRGTVGTGAGCVNDAIDAAHRAVVGAWLVGHSGGAQERTELSKELMGWMPAGAGVHPISSVCDCERLRLRIPQPGAGHPAIS